MQSLLPYNVSLYKGNYIFQTLNEVTYTCGFSRINFMLSPILGIYDIEIFDFEFYPYSSERIASDQRVAATIIHLLSGFFSNENRVLVYVCDSSDGKAKERQKLFKKWHGSFSGITNQDNLEIELEGLGTSYGSILTRKDFPYKDILQTELVDKARGIMLEKYDS